MLKWFCEKSSTKEQSLWTTSILTQLRTYVHSAAIFLWRNIGHNSSSASSRAFPSQHCCCSRMCSPTIIFSMSSVKDVPVLALNPLLHSCRRYLAQSVSARFLRRWRPITVLSLRTCHSSRVSAPRCTLHIRTARGSGLKTNATMACWGISSQRACP